MWGVALILIILATMAGAVTLAFRTSRDEQPSDGRSVATIGFAVIGVLLTGAGISGLVRYAIPTDELVADNTDLARALAFVAVGIPLTVGLWRQISPWIKSDRAGFGWTLGWPVVVLWSLTGVVVGTSQSISWLFGGDPSQAGVGRMIGWSAILIAASAVETTHHRWIGRQSSLGLWALILPVVSSIALAGTVIGLGLGLTWLVGGDPNPDGLGFGLTLGAVWAATRIAERRLHPGHDLTVVAWGFISLVALMVSGTSFLAALFGEVLDRLTSTAVIGEGGLDRLLEPAVWTVWSAGWWVWLWLKDALRRPESGLRKVYSLLVGVALPSLVLITSLGWALFVVAEWFLGTPEESTLRAQLDSLPILMALAIVAGGSLLHHRRVAGVPGTEDRAARYIVAGAGLGAATSGISSVIVALLTALSGDIAAGDSGTDLLLGGLIALGVGGASWWSQWSALTDRATADLTERTRPSRKLYMGLTLVVSALTSLFSLVALVFELFRAILGSVDLLSQPMIIEIGLLGAALLTGLYHWAIWKEDKKLAPAPAAAAAPQPPREILVVSGSDAAQLQAGLAGPSRRLWVWQAEQLGGGHGQEALLEAIEANNSPRILLIDRADGIETIELAR